jgi:hypothetical protein
VAAKDGGFTMKSSMVLTKEAFKNIAAVLRGILFPFLTLLTLTLSPQNWGERGHFYFAKNGDISILF